MCLLHVPERNKSVQQEKPQETPTKTMRPTPCRNGPQCSFHMQFWCSFFHPQPPQEQQEPSQQQQPQPWQHEHRLRWGSAPGSKRTNLGFRLPPNQWKLVPSWRPHPIHSQWVHLPPSQQTQRPGGASRLNTTPWCKHIHNCMQGQFCVLRQEVGQDFPNPKMQRMRESHTRKK